MNDSTDTIAAQATPPGRGGVGIVRISGPKSRECAEVILGHCPKPRYAEYLPFSDGEGEVLDEGIALFFPGPHSFTGEDVLELQGHGGPVVMDRLLALVQRLGVRLARPGEFSERAFLNDKLDLAQAEAIADLIDASSEQAARSALRSLRGEFSARVDELVERLTELRIYVESAIDFPEEEIDFLADGEVQRRLDAIRGSLAAVQQAAQQGSLLKEGMTVVLAGLPNAGKSSLLNALAGQESAIVTEIAGTTRDVLREQINLDGMPLHIIDTAGLRESADAVEQEGIRRAWREIEQADRLLLLVDDTSGVTADERAVLKRLPHGLATTVIRNKADLSGNPPALLDGELGSEIRLSAKTGEGVELLRDYLKQSMGYQGSGEGSFMARRRHLDALGRAAANLVTGDQLLQQGSGELLAEELRLAQQALGEITGEVSSDDLLGKIFASFCIGK
ncbi:MAG: tRNA uridine-5-carboxymethylaminomethyl(34) synthesis GTPase MnmE [Gammaproteobacteria bacterium]|nr:tRNA uridine-5-carboxymethylaminomethyl(34) synthesis GTPase MnmE [Gammaproteobacteria bacterium]